MLYAIFFVLLLAVAIFLKSKQDKSKADSKDHHKSAKRTASKAKVRHTATNVAVESQPVEQHNGPTPVDEKIKATIQQHMSSGNYSVAEAYINQCLNKDPSLHELYLELMAIHLAQKDDFSAEKLLEQLQQLGLTNVYEQAQIKYKATKYIENTPVQDDISSPLELPEHPAEEISTNNAFKHLTQTQWQAPKVEDQSGETLPDLAFVSSKVEQVQPVAPTQPAEKTLDFDFTAPSIKGEDNPVTLTPPHDSLTVEETPTTLAFDLDEKVQPTPQQEPVSLTPLEFDLSTPSVNVDATPAASEPAPTALDFSFELAPEATPHIEETTAEMIPPAAVQSAAEDMDPNDPIVVNFPHLREVLELDLDLELAEEYIQLGAYEAARSLLNPTAQWSAEQQAKYDALQARLAS